VRCNDVRVFEEEGDCSVCLEMSDDELMRHLISGELTNYRVVCTRPKPLQMRFRLESLMETWYRNKRGVQGRNGTWGKIHEEDET
jgi:hypothetical protein